LLNYLLKICFYKIFWCIGMCRKDLGKLAHHRFGWCWVCFGPTLAVSCPVAVRIQNQDLTRANSYTGFGYSALQNSQDFRPW